MTGPLAAPVPPPPPAPPRRPFVQTAIDVLVWGGLAIVLLLSFGPVDGARLGQLASNGGRVADFLAGFRRPDFTEWRAYVGDMGLTVQIALWGTALAVVIAVPFGLLGARNIAPPWVRQPTRLLMNVLRSVPDLVIGMVFVVAVGLGPFAGVMALALNTGGVLAKLFAEGVEAIDPRPVEGVKAAGGAPLHEIRWGVLPQVAPLWTGYALYRLESNARSATVLGLIGAGGIGQRLFESIQAFEYAKVAAIVLVIVAAVTLIDLLSQALRARLS